MAITSWSATTPVAFDSTDTNTLVEFPANDVGIDAVPTLTAATSFIHWEIVAGSGATYGLLWPRADQTVVYIDPKPFDADYLLTLGE